VKVEGEHALVLRVEQVVPRDRPRELDLVLPVDDRKCVGVDVRPVHRSVVRLARARQVGEVRDEARVQRNGVLTQRGGETVWSNGVDEVDWWSLPSLHGLLDLRLDLRKVR